MLFLIALSVIGGFLILLYLISPIISPKRLELDRAHVVITGGSSGIGKELAAEVLRRGSSVTIIARNKIRLQEAKSALEVFIQQIGVQKIHCISVDVSGSYDNVENAIKQAEETLGPIDMLINCAGTSVNGKFDDTPIEEFQHMLQINYLGSVYPTRAVISNMKARKFGRIVFVSSVAGQLGLCGCAAYSASKYALRGLAEALQMEIKPFNIHITMAFPPDTDTPGYAEEQKTKPKETQLISETAGLFQPDHVAKAIVADAVQGKFLSFMGVDGYMLSTLTCGMSPVSSIMEATQQVILMGIFRAISLFYLDSFDRIVRKCKAEQENQAQPPTSSAS